MGKLLAGKDHGSEKAGMIGTWLGEMLQTGKLMSELSAGLELGSVNLVLAAPTLLAGRPSKEEETPIPGREICLFYN